MLPKSYKKKFLTRKTNLPGNIEYIEASIEAINIIIKNRPFLQRKLFWLRKILNISSSKSKCAIIGHFRYFSFIFFVSDHFWSVLSSTNLLVIVFYVRFRPRTPLVNHGWSRTWPWSLLFTKFGIYLLMFLLEGFLGGGD